MEPVPKVNILIVDDQKNNLTALEALLESLGERIVRARGGAECLRRVLDDDFAVILMDVQMPDMDGFETAGLIREREKSRWTPIIFLTAFNRTDAQVLRAYSMGAVDFLFKPIVPEVLKAKVAVFVEQYRKTRHVTLQADLLLQEERERQRGVAESLARTASELSRVLVERERAEQARADMLEREKRARAEAENANRLKDEFLATLSHELRTPLNAILGWAGVLATIDSPVPEMKSGLDAILRNARMQARLIDDLLDLSRITSGKLLLDVGMVNLATVVQDALESLSVAAKAKDLRMSAELDASVGPVAGDARRVQQIVWNLLSNAVKFSGNGGRVEVRLDRKDSCARIRVADSGQGIEREFLPHVFERFRQADGSTSRNHGGLGLGLAIARQFVELHGGSISAESEGAGKGAVFTVLLPISADPALRKPAAALPVGDHSTALVSADYAGMLAGIRILLVEDDADSSRLVTTLFERRGAVVTAVASTAEAIDSLHLGKPDVLVSDIGMPGEDGYVLMRKLRTLWPEWNLPALALTAYAMAEDRERAMAAGYREHLAKPVDPAMLASTVARLVRTARLAEGEDSRSRLVAASPDAAAMSD